MAFFFPSSLLWGFGLSSLTYCPLLQGQSQGNDQVTVGHAYAYWNVENPGFPAKKSS
jgi:hypothetical protein